jgi:hypothetical protein
MQLQVQPQGKLEPFIDWTMTHRFCQIRQLDIVDNPARTLSELELFRQRHNLEDDGQGEFYTAIGRDGNSHKIHL